MLATEYFSSVPEPWAVVSTDTQGRFAFRLPPSKQYWILPQGYNRASCATTAVVLVHQNGTFQSRYATTFGIITPGLLPPVSALPKSWGERAAAAAQQLDVDIAILADLTCTQRTP
jgi:hypothetical protein